MMNAETAQQLEPWPGYFDLRSKEIEVLFRFWKPERIGNFLEVGCGLGFVSTIFSGMAERVYATDLPEKDESTNTPGMDRAIRFLRCQDRKNIFLFGGDAVSLPVRSDSMDTVFSMNILEHIPLEKRDSAVSEMKRAVKDGGYVMAIVPAVTERLGNFFYYYIDLASRLVKKILRVDKKAPIGGKGNPGAKKSVTSRFLPPIHGYYKSRIEEIANQFPHKWEDLFRRNGLEIVKTFTIRFSPFTTRPFISLYKRASWIDSFLGDKVPFKYLGKNYCIIARR